MLTFGDIQKKLYIFVCSYIFGFYFWLKNNHFYGLNESSDLLDCIFYSSIVFSGSGYAKYIHKLV